MAEDNKNSDKRPEAKPQQKLDVGLYSKKLDSFVQRIDLVIQEISSTMYTNNSGFNANLENSIVRMVESKFWLANLKATVIMAKPKEKSPIVKAN